MFLYYQDISIHALLAESDTPPRPTTTTPSDFNPRSPCGERLSAFSRLSILILFQSTLSLRRATRLQSPRQTRPGHFNPRSPCGERLISFRTFVQRVSFQSTLSLRRATGLLRVHGNRKTNFNPRSPCGERPGPGAGMPQARANFNPRSPCGERRHVSNILDGKEARFQSTLSLRRATPVLWHGYIEVSNFNPRSPCGERPRVRQATEQPKSISIHALLAESDHVEKD